MNILYDHQAVSTHRYGGIARYFYEIANRIGAIEGNNVEIFAPFYVSEYFKQGDVVTPKGFHIPPIPRSLRAIRAINNLASASLRGRKNVDIFHETYYSRHDYCPSRAKRIVTVYDMIHEKFRGDFSESDMTSTEKALAVRRADHVICISEQTRHDLIELLGVDSAKTSIVHLGFALTKQDGPVQIEGISPQPFLLYVGSRRGYKNFAMLTQAYAASVVLRSGFSLICFGGGGFTSDEKELFRKLGLSGEQVRHISGGDEVLATYYRLASAFVYPSLYEGFGIPPLEAMSFDCPVVCSGVSSIPEVVGNAAEMFDPYDVDSMRGVIERVVTDSALRDSLVIRGRERIRLFSWERCAQESLNVYRQVLT